MDRVAFPPPLAGEVILSEARNRRGDTAPSVAPLRGSTAPPQAGEQTDALRHAAREFESVFLAEMMQPMFEGLSTDGLGGGGVGEEMFRPMLIEQYASAISHAGGVGIADSIVRELTRIQTVTPEEAADGAHR